MQRRCRFRSAWYVRLTLPILFAGLLLSCRRSGRGVLRPVAATLSGEALSPPCWLSEPECVSPPKGFHRFIGHSKTCTSKEAATNQAREDVTNQIVAYQGAAGLVDLLRETPLSGRTDLIDSSRVRELGVRWVLDDLIEGNVYPEERFLEPLQIGEERCFRAHILVHYPERALATLLIHVAREGGVERADEVVALLRAKYGIEE
ncbi:MAG: hypothetical protein D6812_07800 [Deltaproteobacteria bacterium]|nr:MAG: hypothetical protein D6812_07800 [Deltaproteobacteria bacterium]